MDLRKLIIFHSWEYSHLVIYTLASAFSSGAGTLEEPPMIPKQILTIIIIIIDWQMNTENSQNKFSLFPLTRKWWTQEDIKIVGSVRLNLDRFTMRIFYINISGIN